MSRPASFPCLGFQRLWSAIPLRCERGSMGRRAGSHGTPLCNVNTEEAKSSGLLRRSTGFIWHRRCDTGSERSPISQQFPITVPHSLILNIYCATVNATLVKSHLVKGGFWPNIRGGYSPHSQQDQTPPKDLSPPFFIAVVLSVHVLGIDHAR